MKLISTIVSGLVRLFSTKPGKEIKKAVKEAVSTVKEEVEVVEATKESRIEVPKHSTKIVIDPGHGGSRKRIKGVYTDVPDVGAVGEYKGQPLYERDVVMKISEELGYILADMGYKVVLTRVDNKELSTLQKKVKIVSKEEPEIFVSIHANANAGTPAEGIETLYNASREDSLKLASAIQDSMISSFSKHKNRGIKPRSNLYVLKRHSVQACALVECEFINHPKQAEFLVKKPKEIAFSIAKGIEAFRLSEI